MDAPNTCPRLKPSFPKTSRRKLQNRSQRVYTKLSRHLVFVSQMLHLVMRTIYTTGAFDRWFDSLRDKQAARRIQVRIDRAQDGNFGDHKPVGEGVSEMRIHHGPGLRVYFTVRGTEIIILLAGGDKATQAKDIHIAQDLARQLKE